MLHDLSRQLRQLLNEATRSNAPQRPAHEDRNVIRLRYVSNAASYRTPQDWHHRLLIKHGTRMHAASLQRGDGCSIAILDARGMVVAWHDTLPGARTFAFEVTGAHVSQFYLPRDVTFGRPARDLIAACMHGSDTQQRWHQAPGGAIFRAITVIEALRLKSGELNGYSHVTRYMQNPSGLVLADLEYTPRRHLSCYGAVAVA